MNNLEELYLDFGKELVSGGSELLIEDGFY